MTKSVTQNKYAIVLLKNNSIVQVRVFNGNEDEVVRHAKAFNKNKQAWYEKVVVVKTIDHMSDLLSKKKRD